MYFSLLNEILSEQSQEECSLLTSISDFHSCVLWCHHALITWPPLSLSFSSCEQLPADGPQKHDIQTPPVTWQTLCDRAAQHLGSERPPGVSVRCLKPRPPPPTWRRLSDTFNVNTTVWPLTGIFRQVLLLNLLMTSMKYTGPALSHTHIRSWTHHEQNTVRCYLCCILEKSISSLQQTEVAAHVFTEDLKLHLFNICLIFLQQWETKKGNKQQNSVYTAERSFLVFLLLLPEWFDMFLFCTSERCSCKEELWERFVHFAFQSETITVLFCY